MSHVIVLRTERLILRELTFSDVDNLLTIFSDPIAMQFYPATKGRAETEHWIERNRNSYREHGFGLWAMECRTSGRFLGECGLTIQQVDGIPREEIGYHVIRECQGRGYATEAALACRDFAFHHLGLTELICWTNPGNVASRRVAEKIGMTLEKETIDNGGRPAVVYVLQHG